jgi:hypothetical protein
MTNITNLGRSALPFARELLSDPQGQQMMFSAANLAMSGMSPMQIAMSVGPQFLATPQGRAMGAAAVNAMVPMFEPFTAPVWNGLTKAAAEPGNITKLVSGGLSGLSKYGVEAGEIGKLGGFAETLLKTATTDGLAGVLKAGGPVMQEATKLLPMAEKLLPMLGKLGKMIPGVGLAMGLLNAIKTFANPNASMGQKLSALLDVAGGAAGLIPGLGTGAQLAIGAATTVGGMAAESVGSSSTSKPWTPPK